MGRLYIWIAVLITTVVFVVGRHLSSAVVNLCVVDESTRTANVGTPLTDWSGGEYSRLVSLNPAVYEPTGYTDSGGLYAGSNNRPDAHEASGIDIATNTIVRRDATGNPSSNGKIGLMAIGMSNTSREFTQFMRSVYPSEKNEALMFVNGAKANNTLEQWRDVNNPIWQYAKDQATRKGITPAQVQVVWIKLTEIDFGTFPQKAESIRDGLYQVVQHVITHFPNARLAYLSSRSHAFNFFDHSKSPEPVAYENGFAVKWLIQNQIAGGDPNLNFNQALGNVTSPWLSWGPYLWNDMAHTRSDGFVWTPEDLVSDCVHPSPTGEQKVANLLENFFNTDRTSIPWYLPTTTTPTPTPLVSPTPAPTGSVTPTPTTSPNPTPTSGTRPTRTPTPTP